MQPNKLKTESPQVPSGNFPPGIRCGSPGY